MQRGVAKFEAFGKYRYASAIRSCPAMQTRLLISTSLIALGAATLPARADLLIDANIGMLPFGPFTPTKEIVVTGSIVNISNQDVTVCEGAGVCVGASVATTYELGGFASSPNGYTFSFGDGSDPSAGFLDGKASGTYMPGQEKSFVFGEYTPDGGIAAPGTYSFDDQLQIFAATPDRPMVGSSSFGGTWQVVPASIPEPSSLALLGSGLLLGALRRRCVSSVPLLLFRRKPVPRLPAWLLNRRRMGRAARDAGRGMTRD